MQPGFIHQPQERQAAPELDATLKKHLQGRLPDYMVPAHLVFLDALPRTPNGKLDRKRLPAPECRAPEPDLPPRTAAEHAIARIWQEVLRVPHVGMQDNFFEQGGHSLLATQVVARIRESFGVQFPMRLMFEQPTIAATALSVEELLVEQLNDMSEEEAERMISKR